MVGISLLNLEAGTAPNGSSVVRPNAFGWAQAFPDVQSFVNRRCPMILRSRKPSHDSKLSSLRNGLLLASRDCKSRVRSSG
jgi:hypothetical protein